MMLYQFTEIVLHQFREIMLYDPAEISPRIPAYQVVSHEFSRFLADELIGGDDRGRLLGRQGDRVEVGGAAEVAGAVEDDLVVAVAAAAADAGVALEVRTGRVAFAGGRAVGRGGHGRVSARRRL